MGGVEVRRTQVVTDTTYAYALTVTSECVAVGRHVYCPCERRNGSQSRVYTASSHRHAQLNKLASSSAFCSINSFLVMVFKLS